MTLLKLLAGSTLLAAAGASAQMKPMQPPSSTGSVALPSSDSSNAFKEIAAQAAADKWLAMIDRGEYGQAWDDCAQLFRQRVTRQQWIDSLPTTRAPFGPMKARKVELAAYRASLPGAPDGQYVTVRFRTQFEKREDVEELVTLSLEDGLWRPTGYGIR